MNISNTDEDLTKNLESLTFDSDITREDQREILSLRKRGNIFTVNIVAHITYYIAVLNEIKRKIFIRNNPKQRNYCRVKLGLIGCGRLGTHILNATFQYSNVRPCDVTISVRQPELLFNDLIKQGVTCISDNKEVAKSVEFLILCFSPSQVDLVLQEINGYVQCFVYSVVTGIGADKIRRYINYMDVYKPIYSINKNETHNEICWDFVPVVKQLHFLEFREQYCPLNIDDTKKILRVDTKIMEILFYLAINICLSAHLSREKSLECVIEVMFRKCDHDKNIFKDMYESSCFHDNKFNLQRIEETRNILTEIFADSKCNLTISARLQYEAIFDRFTDWRQ